MSLNQEEINQLVRQGGQDILNVIYDALAGETAFLSSLKLAINQGNLPVNADHVRALIIDINRDVLSRLSFGDPQLLKVMSVATGRLMQLQELKAAISRIQDGNGGEESESFLHLEAVKTELELLEKLVIKMYFDEGDELALEVVEPSIMPSFIMTLRA